MTQIEVLTHAFVSSSSCPNYTQTFTASSISSSQCLIATVCFILEEMEPITDCQRQGGSYFTLAWVEPGNGPSCHRAKAGREESSSQIAQESAPLGHVVSMVHCLETALFTSNKCNVKLVFVFICSMR